MIRNNRFSVGSLIPNKYYTTSSSAAFLKVEYEDIFAGYRRDFIVLAADKKDSRPNGVSIHVYQNSKFSANTSLSPFARAGIFDIISVLESFQYGDFQYLSFSSQ